MFHIKRTEMISKTFRLPEDMLLELEVLAQNNNVSMNNLVVQCCRYALDHLSPESAQIPDNLPIHLTKETSAAIHRDKTEEAER